jgi:hypothetical protein
LYQGITSIDYFHREDFLIKGNPWNAKTNK